MLTINDVEKYKFGTSVFGFSRADVEEFVSQVVETLQHYVEEIERLKKEQAKSESEIESFRANEETLRNTIVMAQKSRDEIIAMAHREAEIILREARLSVVELNTQHVRLTAERERFEFEFYGLLKGFLQMLERKNPGLARVEAGDQSVPSVPLPASQSTDDPGGHKDVVFPQETPR